MVITMISHICVSRATLWIWWIDGVRLATLFSDLLLCFLRLCRGPNRRSKKDVITYSNKRHHRQLLNVSPKAGARSVCVVCVHTSGPAPLVFGRPESRARNPNSYMSTGFPVRLWAYIRPPMDTLVWFHAVSWLYLQHSRTGIDNDSGSSGCSPSQCS